MPNETEGEKHSIEELDYKNNIKKEFIAPMGDVVLTSAVEDNKEDDDLINALIAETEKNKSKIKTETKIKEEECILPVQNIELHGEKGNEHLYKIILVINYIS